MIIPPPPMRDEPAVQAAHVITRLAIALLLVVAPVASVSTRSAIYVLVPVGVALTLVAWVLAPGGRGFQKLLADVTSPTGVVALFLIGWAGVSLIWTPFGVGPVERYIKSISIIALAVAATALLPERTKTSNLYLLPIGAALGGLTMVALAVLEPARFNRPFNPEISLIDRSAFGLALLAWPALGALVIRGKPSAAVALAFVTLVAELAAGVPLALIATAVGALIFAAALSAPRRTARLMGLIGAALFIAAPLAALAVYLLTPPGHAPEWLNPLVVWGHVVVYDGLRALIGHGFDSARQGVLAGYLHPMTPHSVIFSTWFELGIVGVAAAMAFCFRFTERAGLADERFSPFLLAGAGVAFVICVFGLGIAPIWWVTLLALDGFAFALLHHGHARIYRPGVNDIAENRQR